jgi:hypothetical protein
MPVFFRHGDESAGVGDLAQLKLSAHSLEVNAFGSQKFKFARKMIENYLGACITFRMETENDLKGDLRKRLAESKERGVGNGTEENAEKENEIPPEIRAEVLGKFHEQHYRQFIDSPVPMLDNKTPRQAARDKKLRPKLIDLIKIYLHGIAKKNCEDHCFNLDIDWVIDELGLGELKKGGPA